MSRAALAAFSFPCPCSFSLSPRSPGSPSNVPERCDISSRIRGGNPARGARWGWLPPGHPTPLGVRAVVGLPRLVDLGAVSDCPVRVVAGGSMSQLQSSWEAHRQDMAYLPDPGKCQPSWGSCPFPYRTPS